MTDTRYSTIVAYATKFDHGAIRTHFQALHDAAKRANIPGGKLVLAVYGEDPDSKERFANVRHFDVGDSDGMAAAAMEFDGQPHRNIYAPLVVLRADTKPGSRKEKDIAAVLGFVIDGDADHGHNAPTSPVPPDYVLESSAGNLQSFLWLDRPLTGPEAKPFGDALKRATGADSANDIGHVWRVPGCLNWPNAAKLKRGRSRDPQPVRVKWPWAKWTRLDDLRAALAPHWEKPRAERAATAASLDAPKFDHDRLARWIDRKVEHKWKDDPDSPWNHQGEWIFFGKAIKISFPNEDGLALWMRATHEGHDTAEKRWNSQNDFRPDYVEGMRTLKYYTERDVDWMFGDVPDLLSGKLKAPPLAPTGPLPDDVPRPGPCDIDGDEEEAGESTELRTRRIDAASLEGKPVPDREWQVHGLIPAKNVTLLYGDGGTGKSLLALQLGVAVVTGKPFFGHAVKQGRVEFITAEDSLDEMHRRLADVGRSGVPLGALAGLHLTSLADADAMLAMAADSRGGALAVTALYGELESVIADSRPALVVLDTLADVFGGNEIIRAQARQFIGMLRRLCLHYGCTIVVLAHPSLAGMEKGTSGSTAWGNSVRSRLYFKRIHETDGSEPDENARVLSVGKSNYGRVGLEIRMQWRVGIFASTGGSGGDPMVSAIKAERVFLELLAKYAAQNRHVSVSEGKSYAPFVFRNDAAREGVSKHALKEAMERLINLKKIENAPYGAPSKKMFRLYVIDLPTPANGMPTPANAPQKRPANAC
jgi:RecA-family ATPase